MDNITHSLIGVTLSRAFIETPSTTDSQSGGAKPTYKKAAFFTLLIANNIPDIDFVLRPFVGDLGYLIHHRGATHTVFLGVWLGLLSGALGALIARMKYSRTALLKLWGWGVLGVFFHILADSWNDYGVHPFSPFVSNWIYGGFIFILEPALWCSMLPLVYFSTTRKWVKAGVLVLLGALLGVASFTSYGSLGLGFAILVWLSIFWMWTSRSRGALPAAVGVLTTLAVFGFSSIYARQLIRQEMSELKPSEVEVDLIMGPSPANPFCWRAVWVGDLGEVSRDRQFTVRGGTTSLAPSLISPESCSFWRYGDSVVLHTPHSHFTREERGSVSDLRRLASVHCGVREMLHFARAPFWSIEADPVKGDQITIGDARYAFRSTRSFSKFTFSMNGYECKFSPAQSRTPFQNYFGF